MQVERDDILPKETVVQELVWGVKVKASEVEDPREIETAFESFPYIVGQTLLPFSGDQDMIIYLAQGTRNQALVERFKKPKFEEIEEETKKWNEFSLTPRVLVEK